MSLSSGGVSQFSDLSYNLHDGIHSSPKRKSKEKKQKHVIKKTDPKKMMKDFAKLVVLDFLQSDPKYRQTFEKFSEEIKEGIEGQLSSLTESWYSISQHLALNELLSRNDRDPEKHYGTILEVLLDEFLDENRIKMRNPVTVEVKHAKSNKILGNYKYKNSPHPGVSRSQSKPEFVHDSKEDLFDRALQEAAESPTSQPVSDHHGMHSNVVLRTAALSAARGLSVARSSLAMSQAPADFERDALRNSFVKSSSGLLLGEKDRNSARHKMNKKKTPFNKVQENTEPHIQKIIQQMPKKNVFSEESWMPMNLRLRMIRRNMTVVKQNVEQEQERSKMVEKISKKQQKLLEKPQPDDDPPKIPPKPKKPQPTCALCVQTFSPGNLPLSVSYKAIFDLRKTFKQRTEQLGIPPVPTMSSEGSSEALKKVGIPEAYQNPPLCYDETRVCKLCSQFFKAQQDTYRPSYSSVRARERAKFELLAKEKAAAYWDPLKKLEKERKKEETSSQKMDKSSLFDASSTKKV